MTDSNYNTIHSHRRAAHRCTTTIYDIDTDRSSSSSSNLRNNCIGIESTSVGFYYTKTIISIGQCSIVLEREIPLTILTTCYSRFCVSKIICFFIVLINNGSSSICWIIYIRCESSSISGSSIIIIRYNGRRSNIGIGFTRKCCITGSRFLSKLEFKILFVR